MSPWLVIAKFILICLLYLSNYRVLYPISLEGNDGYVHFLCSEWTGQRWVCYTFCRRSLPVRSKIYLNYFILILLLLDGSYSPKGNDYEDEPDNVTPLVASPYVSRRNWEVLHYCIWREVITMLDRYYYPDSESAPSRNHLSLPVGKTGELVGKVEDFIPEYSCWNDWDPLGNVRVLIQINTKVLN